MRSALAIGITSVLAVAGAGLYGAHRLLDRVDEAGYQRGLAEARTACHAADLSRLAAATTALEAQATAAQQASRVLEKTIAERRAADRQTTQELRHALAQSAPARVHCVLPADVMQQLAAARAAAARAAAEGLPRGAADRLPAAGGAGGQQLR